MKDMGLDAGWDINEIVSSSDYDGKPSRIPFLQDAPKRLDIIVKQERNSFSAELFSDNNKHYSFSFPGFNFEISSCNSLVNRTPYHSVRGNNISTLAGRLEDSLLYFSGKYNISYVGLSRKERREFRLDFEN